jgi:hypothetical protein
MLSTAPDRYDLILSRCDMPAMSASGQEQSFVPDQPKVRFARKAVIRQVTVHDAEKSD